MRILHLVIVLSLLQISGYAQEPLLPVDVRSKDKSELYRSGREWFAENFKSPGDALQLDDPENGKLIGRINNTMGIPFQKTIVPLTAAITVTVEVKDFKYRYVIDGISIGNGPTYTLDYYQSCTSEEFVSNEFKRQNVKATKKMVEDAIVYNQHLTDSISAAIKRIEVSLNKKMQSEQQDW